MASPDQGMDVEHGGDALLSAILQCGGCMGFGVPGESYLALLDAMAKTDDFTFYQTRHEAGAANMAEAYGKLTGEPGLAFVTRGPGATHASIGLHTAFQDSTPLILFIGQVASNQRDREAFQEMDYKAFFSECTKWSATIDDASRIGEYVARAFAVATSGRPGPVALALPEDMLSGAAEAPRLQLIDRLPPEPAIDDIRALQIKLKCAKKPVLLVGGSSWNQDAVAMLSTLATEWGIPVATSFRAQDRLDNRHVCYVGEVGIAESPVTRKIFDEADLIIALGPRLGEMTTGSYKRMYPPLQDQNLVHIHQHGDELGSVYHATLQIEARPKPMLDAMLDRIDTDDLPDWSDWLAEMKGAYHAWHLTDSETATKSADLDLGAVYQTLKTKLPEDVVLTNGAGNYAAWLHRFMPYRAFPSQLAPTSGAMGYGVPAAIAAKITAPDRPVVCFAGDGCFMMSVQELATAAQHRAGIVFLVFNNSQYGTIKMHQHKEYPGRPSGTGLENPDFVALAKSFGFGAALVERTKQFAPVLDEALAVTKDGTSYLIELRCDPAAIAPGLRTDK